MTRSSGQRNPGNRHGRNESRGKQIKGNKHAFYGGKKGTSQIPFKKESIPVTLRSVPKAARGVVKLHVLDTNVLMGAPDSIYKFDEHDVCVPGQVWKELDKYKKAKNDIGVNSRTVIRRIDELLNGLIPQKLNEGIPLVPPENLSNGKPHKGRLILDFSQPKLDPNWDFDLNLDEPDDRIIAICLRHKANGREVVLVSNDGNCRVKARMCGIAAETYLNEAVDLTGEEDVVTGFHEMPNGFWEKSIRGEVEASSKGSVTSYAFTSPVLKKVNCNEFLLFEDGLKLMVVDKPSPHKVIAETVRDFSHGVYGVIPRNVQQEFALQLLTDQSISAVSIAGKAGSGKTLLALAAALSQTFDKKHFRRIIVTRPAIGAEEDIGFLPGTEREKMDPWMGALYDNLEILNSPKDSNGDKTRDIEWEKVAGTNMLMNKIDVLSLNYMKGRTLNNTFIIVDEAQDTTKPTLKMILTRLGVGSKIVILGNVAQIDNTYVTEYTCGISIFVRTFSDTNLAGHITLQKGERNPFADLAEERL